MKSIGFNQEYLHEALHYSPSDGLLTWKERPLTHFKFKRDYLGWNKRFAGTPAFKRVHKDGYLQGCINNRRYKAHRLAWFYVYGVWPTNEIDHKDTIKTHNWIENLRDVTHSGNQQNKIKALKNSKTGFLGVCFNKENGKYKAQISVSGKKKYIGYFDSAEEAHNAYLITKRELHLTCTI